MNDALMIDGELNGEVRGWPRADLTPCIFPTRTGVTRPYFLHAIRSGSYLYRVASELGYLYPQQKQTAALRLLALPLLDFQRVRTER